MTPKKKSQTRLALLIALAVWLIAIAIATAVTILSVRADLSYAILWGILFFLPALFFFLFLIESLDNQLPLWRRLCFAFAVFLMLPLMHFLGKSALGAIQLARTAFCYANLGQVGLGVIMYAEDNGNHIPPADSWVDATLPFTRTIKVYKCPADLTKARCSYAMNADLSGVDIHEIKHPDKVVLLYDTNTPGPNPSGGKADFPAKGRHRGKIRVVFVDGHVGLYDPATKSPPLEWEITADKNPSAKTEKVPP